MNYPELLVNYPPVLIRLLARKRYGPPLTGCEIGDAARTLTDPEVEAISKATSWDGISVTAALAFQRGCGVELHDPKTMRRVTDYLTKRPTFRYLRASKDWVYYQSLLRTWRKSYPQTIPAGMAVNGLTVAPHILALLKRLNVLTK